MPPSRTDGTATRRRSVVPSRVRTVARPYIRMLPISRPALWINTIGSGVVGVWLTGELWSWTALPVLLWLTLPFNLLIYGVNDVFDQETDAANPRKGTAGGARIASHEVRRIWTAVAVTNAPFLAWFAVALPATAVLWMLVYCVVFVFYSAPPLRFKARPYLDSLSNAAYALPLVFVPLSLGAQPVWPAVVALMAWSVAKHAFDAVQDIDEDRRAGIATTAVRLGPRGTLVWCALWWTVATAGFATVSIPVAVANALIAGALLVGLYRRPDPVAARRLYPFSVAFPYVAGSVVGVQLTVAIFLGVYP